LTITDIADVMGHTSGGGLRVYSRGLKGKGLGVDEIFIKDCHV
jgi:hypothetical protein